MSFDSKKAEYKKEHIYVVEMDLDYCTLTSGVGPCTASETGDDKCFNTFESTNDAANYDAGIKTYRFCTDRSPHPLGLDAIPSLRSVNIAPAIIDIRGGLGVRSNASITFKDHPSSDIDIDKYVSERSWIAFERGTFWTKLRARNPNYQFRELRVLSGYLVNGIYDASNFQTHYFIIDRMDVSNGIATVTGKDPLKLASNKRAQAPAVSTGTISDSGGINSSVTTINLQTGEGADYAASGAEGEWIVIDSEVMEVTAISTDELTVTRGQFNTVAVAHSQSATVQRCLEYSGATRGKLDFIVNDLVTTYAGINSSFIPTAAWASEVNNFLSGLLSGIIVKPMDVWKLLRELSAEWPHYLWWDDRSQLINLTALVGPDETADVLDMDENLVASRTQIKDLPDGRISTVIVNFGQFDPTKKIDEPTNFSQSYARIDSDSIIEYQTNITKVINSRWMLSINAAAAIKAATLIGRRFSDTQRHISFSLEDKDSDGANGVWAGMSRAINHRDMVDFTGLPQDTIFQIISAKKSNNYDFTGIEFKYGGVLPDDAPELDDVVYYSEDTLNANMYDDYFALYGAPAVDTEALFIVRPGVIMGSVSNGTPSMDTGNSWPAFTTGKITLQNNGFIVGAGGQGEEASGASAATVGGTAINLQEDLTLDNLGVIGGGGGGGGAIDDTKAFVDGGGGAGGDVGLRGGGLTAPGPPSTIDIIIQAESGTTEFGGDGAVIFYTFAGEPFVVVAGDGGDLGMPGGLGGAAGGAAIVDNGNTITYTNIGDIRGPVSPPTDFYAYWTMDDTSGSFFDSAVGNANTISVIQNITFLQPGQVNKATEFNGSNSRGVLSSVDVANFKEDEFSVIGWLRYPDLIATGGIFSCILLDSGDLYGWRIRAHASGVISINTYEGSGTTPTASINTIVDTLDDDFHQFGFSYKQSTQAVKCYLNGFLKSSATASGGGLVYSGSTMFGTVGDYTHDGGFIHPYKGRQDNLKFFKRELSASEFLADFITDSGT